MGLRSGPGVGEVIASPSFLLGDGGFVLLRLLTGLGWRFHQGFMDQFGLFRQCWVWSARLLL